MYGPFANEGFSAHAGGLVPGNGMLGRLPEGSKASRHIRNAQCLHEQPASGLVCTNEWDLKQ